MTEENSTGMPTPADDPFELDENSGTETKFPDRSVPATFDEVQTETEPVADELTLLRSEPSTPTVISDQKHARVLLGYAHQELSDEMLYKDLMHYLYMPVRRSFYKSFLDFARDDRRKDYDWLSARGFEEPEDLLDGDAMRNLLNALWTKFLSSNLIVDSAKVNRAIAEELVARERIAWQYLDQLPTEPDFDPERRETSEMAIQHRDGWVTQDRQRINNRDEYDYDERPPRQQNSRDRKLNLVSYPPKKTEEVVSGYLSKARADLTQKRFYNEFVPDVYSTAIGAFAGDFQAEYLAVGGYGNLKRLGFHEPEDLFRREQVENAFSDLFEFYFEDNDPIGPYTKLKNYIVTIAYKKYGLVDERTYKETR
jgi:hypothetical protein